MSSNSLSDEDTRSDVGGREISDGVAARFVEKDYILDIGDPLASQLDAHPSAEWLGEQ